MTNQRLWNCTCGANAGARVRPGAAQIRPGFQRTQRVELTYSCSVPGVVGSRRRFVTGRLAHRLPALDHEIGGRETGHADQEERRRRLGPHTR